MSAFDSAIAKPFDYWHGGHDIECLKQIVTARNTTFSGFKVKTASKESALTKLVHSIVCMRQDLEDDLATSTFLNKLWFHVFPKLKDRVALSLDISSALSQFVLIARDSSIYLTSFGYQKSVYLMWSNEHSLEERMRDQLGDKVFYYRHLPLTNGVMVIQSQFLASKFSKWQTRLSDLVTMNALDVFLQRKTRSISVEALTVPGLTL